MVAILRESGGATTPANVLNAVDELQQATEGAIPDDQWKTVIDWCILAGQANSNGAGKSLLAIEINSVAIDDDEFNTWVGSKLDVAFGPRPAKKNPASGSSTPTAIPGLPTNVLPPGIHGRARDDAILPSRGRTGNYRRDMRIRPRHDPTQATATRLQN
jgi:hypothetical protein